MGIHAVHLCTLKAKNYYYRQLEKVVNVGQLNYDSS